MEVGTHTDLSLDGCYEAKSICISNFRRKERFYGRFLPRTAGIEQRLDVLWRLFVGVFVGAIHPWIAGDHGIGWQFQSLNGFNYFFIRKNELRCSDNFRSAFQVSQCGSQTPSAGKTTNLSLWPCCPLAMCSSAITV